MVSCLESKCLVYKVESKYVVFLSEFRLVKSKSTKMTSSRGRLCVRLDSYKCECKYSCFDGPSRCKRDVCSGRPLSDTTHVTVTCIISCFG